MAKIISIGTALPAHAIPQEEILLFMQRAYGIEGTPEARKLKFLYHQSGIATRHSVLPDFLEHHPDNKTFFEVADGCPALEARMERYALESPPLATAAAIDCLHQTGLENSQITHLITVSCTGLSAPGLELRVMEALGLPSDTHRTAVNFMGCYAAIHGLKLAQAFADTTPDAKVLVVCAELCTLHFQNAYDLESAVSAALFGDGASAVLVTSDSHPAPGLAIQSFYSEVLWQGRDEMAWNLSSKGFLMRLTSYVPDLLGADIGPLLQRALDKAGIPKEVIGSWCIHPGGKRILAALEKGLSLHREDLQASYEVLREVGNLSSATLFFVLRKLWHSALLNPAEKVFGVAFGPGLTMESVILQPV
ncbi:MAG: type III polyketide synthase [Sphingobacteriales bacterium]|nr:MAG: type III polyketide synthase [Sphingobacteriales bacterium]